jgi:hypothetical protein
MVKRGGNFREHAVAGLVGTLAIIRMFRRWHTVEAKRLLAFEATDGIHVIVDPAECIVLCNM